MKITSPNPLLVAAAIGLGLASSGCSFIFTRGPEVAPDQVTPLTELKCSGSVAPPVLDTVFTGTHLGGAVFGLTQPDEIFGGGEIRTAVIAADLAWAALHLASAIYGYSRSAECREAKARRNQSIPADTAATLSASPSGAGGFSFGMTKQAAQRACTAAGHAWTSDESSDHCDGTPATSNGNTPVELKFGERGLWYIDIATPSGPAWSRTYTQIQEGMRTRYMVPVQAIHRVPEACATDAQAIGCLQRGEMQVSSDWRWQDDTHVALRLRPMTDKLVIGMLFERRSMGAAPTAQPPSSHVVFWTAWQEAHGATACEDALRLLTVDAQCTGASCFAPHLLSSGYQKNCTVDAETRVSLHKMRAQWKTSAGDTMSDCFAETHAALKDPAKAAALPEKCAGEGPTEAAFRDAARKRATPAPSAPPPSQPAPTAPAPTAPAPTNL